MTTAAAPSTTAFPVPESLRADGSEEGLNQSQLTEWLRCRYKWHLRNRRRVDRRTIALAMDTGSAVHAGLGAAIQRFAKWPDGKLNAKRKALLLDWVRRGILRFKTEWLAEHGITKLSPEMDEELAKLCWKAEQIAWDALQRFDLPRWQILRLDGKPIVEMKLSMPFLPNVPWYGTADVAARDRAAKTPSGWVIDFKCREKFQPPEHEEVDLQLPSYQVVLAHHGIQTVGSIKVQIRSELPADPKRNKDGSMSRARTATTWEHYHKCLLAAKLDPAEYIEEMQPKLDVEFYREDRIYRNSFFLNSIWQNIIEPNARLMVKSKSFPRNMHFLNCVGCWAREFCQAELRGEDTKFLLDTQYVDLTSPTAKLALRAEDIQIDVES